MSLRAKHETPESAGCGIAIDMGASHLRFVLASVEGQILKESRERVHSEAGPRGVIAQIREGIARLIQSKNGLGTLRGIAIGVPGGVDPQTGKVVDANNVPGWREEDMGRELEETFRIPVFLDNDANMAAIGEHWRGVARGIENFVFIALGTGIGAGIFVDGRICRGRNGFAGELFRMNLEWPRWSEWQWRPAIHAGRPARCALCLRGTASGRPGRARAHRTEFRDAGGRGRERGHRARPRTDRVQRRPGEGRA
ncbi:MAG: hypothetical protein DMG83_08855 [Acidobacteria bacterium]|nr:MAG: hypothetical protein DMG83_08855 [Acidobacteriota bacterium]